MSPYTLTPDMNGEGLHIGIVRARFNEDIGLIELDACLQELESLGVDERDIMVVTVPGALELGADDYVAKPCLPRELVARIRAILRRMQLQQQSDLRLQEGPLLLTPASRSAMFNGVALELTSNAIRNAARCLARCPARRRRRWWPSAGR